MVILQPYFSVIAKNADGSQKEAFLKTVKGTLKKLADDGINQKSLLAGINYYEFRSREADFGNAPKGLMYGLQCLDSWLYGGDPLMHLEYEETFAFLKKAAKEGYFEELIRKYLLDNPFEAVITVSPKRGLTAIEDEKLREKLEAYKKSYGRGGDSGDRGWHERAERVSGHPVPEGRFREDSAVETLS
ncbi:MAG: hypothetical protein ACLR8P_11885 [Clostridium fessum]